MDTNAFEAIKSSLKDMSSEQLESLFSAVADTRGVIVVCGAYREEYDDALKDYNKPPLTDNEWTTFREQLSSDGNVEQIRDVWYDTKNEIMEGIRKIWYDDECTDDDNEDEINQDS